MNQNFSYIESWSGEVLFNQGRLEGGQG